jgi:phospholipid transport system substrate-binding protein
MAPMRKELAYRPITAFLVTSLVVAALSLVGGSASLARAATDPMTVVKTVVDQALEVLKDHQTPLPQRQQKLRELVNKNFDFRAMARSALGYHWRNITPEQREEFTKAFTAFVQDSYLSRMQDYSGQQVEVVSSRSQGDGYAEVMTKIVQNGKQPVPVDYLLHRKDDGWRIYDVTVDNISIIANYRNQFNRVVNNQGFDKLLQDLKNKQAELAARLGNSQHAD